MSSIKVLSRTQRIIVESPFSISVFNAGPIGPGGYPGIPGEEGPPGSDADATAAIEAHRIDTTEVHGIIDTSTVVLTNDFRLSNARTPVNHAALHQDGGIDELALDASQTTSGIFVDARIPAAIARGIEVTNAVAAEAVARDNAITNAIITANRQIASYILALTDINKVVEMSVASANTLTIPPNSSVAFPIGTVIEVLQYGVGQTTLTPGAGVTIRSEGSKLKTTAQYAQAALRKIDTDEWIAAGSLIA